PQSQFDMLARMALIPSGNVNLRIDALDSLGQSVGGPGLQQILQNRARRDAVLKTEALPPGLRQGLASVYGAMHTLISTMPPDGLGQPNRGLALAIFDYEAFSSVGANSIFEIRYDVT